MNGGPGGGGPHPTLSPEYRTRGTARLLGETSKSPDHRGLSFVGDGGVMKRIGPENCHAGVAVGRAEECAEFVAPVADAGHSGFCAAIDRGNQ